MKLYFVRIAPVLFRAPGRKAACVKPLLLLQLFLHSELLSFPLLIDEQTVHTTPTLSFRKEVIQPHLPIRLPCYDFTPVIRPAFSGSFLAVRSPISGVTDSHGVTGGVYKTRERIHRSMLICDY